MVPRLRQVLELLRGVRGQGEGRVLLVPHPEGGDSPLEHPRDLKVKYFR